jgi:hypothetical protein
MNFDTLRQWLRWGFWGFAYFTTLVIAYVIFWRLLPATAQVRWSLLALIAIGIVVDVLHKLRPEPVAPKRVQH